MKFIIFEHSTSSDVPVLKSYLILTRENVKFDNLNVQYHISLHNGPFHLHATIIIGNRRDIQMVTITHLPSWLCFF